MNRSGASSSRIAIVDLAQVIRPEVIDLLADERGSRGARRRSWCGGLPGSASGNVVTALLEDIDRPPGFVKAGLEGRGAAAAADGGAARLRPAADYVASGAWRRTRRKSLP